METPPSGSAPSNYPRPNLDLDRQALRDVAAGQKQIIYCILGQVGIFVLNLIAGATQMMALYFLNFALALGLLVFMIMSILKLSKGLGYSQVLCVILMFIPCVSLITLLLLSDKATKRLREAGIKVGFLGADPNSI